MSIISFTENNCQIVAEAEGPASDDISSSMFAEAAAALHIPLCVSLDAIVAFREPGMNPTDTWNIAIDHKKITQQCSEYVLTSGSSLKEAAWLSLSDDVSVTEAAMQYGFSRESVSRAKSKLIVDLQRLFQQ